MPVGAGPVGTGPWCAQDATFTSMARMVMAMPAQHRQSREQLFVSDIPLFGLYHVTMDPLVAGSILCPTPRGGWLRLNRRLSERHAK